MVNATKGVNDEWACDQDVTCQGIFYKCSMNEEGKIVVEIIDEKWLWAISYHVNDVMSNFKIKETHFLYVWGC